MKWYGWFFIIVVIILGINYFNPDIFSRIFSKLSIASIRIGETGIEQIIKNPYIYYGKNVTVKGWLSFDSRNFGSMQCCYEYVYSTNMLYKVKINPPLCYAMVNSLCNPPNEIDDKCAGGIPIINLQGKIINTNNNPTITVDNLQFVSCGNS